MSFKNFLLSGSVDGCVQLHGIVRVQRVPDVVVDLLPLGDQRRDGAQGPEKCYEIWAKILGK